MAAKTPKTAKTKPRTAAGRATPKKPRIDWDAVCRDYRTAKYTDIELATKHKVTREAISRRRKKEGGPAWEQDLSDAIKHATDAALVRSIVTEDHTKVTDTVLAMAEIGKNVILGHRKDLGRLAEVQRKLLNQIEQAVDNLPDLAEVIEMVRKPNENGMDRANDALRKAMERGALADDLKKLADVNEKVRKGEREAFTLDAKPEDDNRADGRTMSDAELAVRLDHLFSKVQQ